MRSFVSSQDHQQPHTPWPWSRMSRRAFLGTAGAALLAACGTAPTGSRTSSPTVRPTSTLAPGTVLAPTVRIEPENAGRVTALGVLDTTTASVRGLAWSPDSRLLAMSASQDAQIWDVKTGQRVATLQGHTSQVDWVAWSPNGSMLATAGTDTTARIWDTQRHTTLKILQDAAMPESLVTVAWSPDSRTLATGDAIGRVQLWEASTGKLLDTWNAPPLPGPPLRLAYAVYGLAWSPDGHSLAANRYDNYLRVWDVQTGKTSAVRQTRQGPNGLAWSPDGHMLTVGDDTGAIEVWDARTWTNTTTLLAAYDPNGWTYSVPWTPDGRLLAATREGALVQIWDPGTGQQLVSLQGHTGAIWAGAWSPDGLWLASGSNDGTARLWGLPG